MSASRIKTGCCVVGGGPGGMFLALLLARHGVDVTLLEAHHDFDRDFRGDTVHPATLDVLDRIGLAHSLHQLPHSKLHEMAMVTGRPERVCGIHFFNPAPAMSLVELVPALTTSDATVAEARAFVEACGKTAVTVKDQAGFVVNALLFPYLNNAVRLFDAGVASRDDIDAAMKGGCNFPMGPLELLDLVGLDTSLAILEALYAEFRDPNYAPAPLLRRMVSAERYGRKSRMGFYDYAR